ncbi:DUF2207 domain-containing protein [Gudongella sp. SC589]|jgi:uncharacterized membrane protein YgcG|uniref:DUF2207 domain-containing protein n=1 Tax=Gudongella sp. SC589 TaxID=3385990 RepID=UPI00390463C3
MFRYNFNRQLPLLIFFILALFLVSSQADATGYNLEISELDITMDIMEDNSYKIVERLTVQFNRSDMHGIFRDIPARTYFGKPVKIEDVDVEGHKFQSSREGDYLSLRIGDPDKYANPIEYYTINYVYNIGDDLNEEMDELYFNLVGDQWEIPIHRTIFTINMPKEFNSASINFTSGYAGSTDRAQVDYTVNGTTISGEYRETISPGQALTIALPLEEGYFSEVEPDGDGIRTFTKSYIALFPILLIGALGLLFKYGRDDPIYPTVEFYPPEDLTPAEIGYVYDNRIDPYDLTSMLIYWADKGYLRIIEEENEEGLIFKKNKTTLKLEKLKPLPAGTKRFESVYFNDLFDTYSIDNVVDVDQLKESFYITLGAVKSELINSFDNRRFLSRSGFFAALGMSALGIIAFILVFLGLFNEINPYSPGLVAVFAIIGGIVLGAFLSASATLFASVKTKLPYERFKTIMTGIFTALVPLAISVLILYITEARALYVMGFVFGIAIIYLSPLAHKRTPQGIKWMQHLLGLKNFIEKAERDRIKQLVDDDPEYFYHILPYAMVLGVTDHWAKNFEGIAMSSPDWYQTNSSRAFHAPYFVSRMDANTKAVGKTMASSPAKSGGGSFGGGSSGGGSGGGGGGGW